jgi:hypothetical protein
MALITDQPQNINFLSPLGFRFKLARTPNVNFFVTDVKLPSISLGFVEVPSPFKIIEIAGNKLDYGDFQLTFRLDEDLESYFEIYNWLTAVGFPENFKQYAKLKNSSSAYGSLETQYSDGTLTILTNEMVPNFEVNFLNMYPTTISDVDFTATDTDVNYISVTVTFKYQIYHIKKVQ